MLTLIFLAIYFIANFRFAIKEDKETKQISTLNVLFFALIVFAVELAASLINLSIISHIF